MEGEEPHERPRDEDVVREEEEAAAAEAARIGGLGGADEVSDEAERPLAEAGEGESEGFEQAEQDLVEHATNLEGPSPRNEAFTAEEERTEAEYGEPDEVDSTETEEDTAGTEPEED
jgi:hypothetical protein